MISEANNSSALDIILKQLNLRAYKHERDTIEEYRERGYIPTDDLQNILTKESIRMGSSDLIRSLEGFILAVIYGYSVTPVSSDGDVLILKTEHIDLGREIVDYNPTLWGSCVFPLLLYGSEYIIAAQELLPPKNIQLTDLGYDESFTYPQFIDNLVRIAVQTRYKHIVKCDVEEILGNPSYRLEDHSDDLITESRFLDVDPT